VSGTPAIRTGNNLRPALSVPSGNRPEGGMSGGPDSGTALEMPTVAFPIIQKSNMLASSPSPMVIRGFRRKKLATVLILLFDQLLL
jgi:hypothetical protein